LWLSHGIIIRKKRRRDNGMVVMIAFLEKKFWKW
jgi:hypothetical protein